MSRLVAVIILTLFCLSKPDFGITQSLPGRNEQDKQLKKLDLYSKLHPVYVRDTLISRVAARKYFHVNLDDPIISLIEKYYQSNYPSQCNLITRSPITFILSPVKGYVTEHYWENVLVTINNIRWAGDVLSFEISMRGEYLKIATIAVSRESFDNAYFLEKDYVPELIIRCKELGNTLKTFLRGKS